MFSSAGLAFFVLNCLTTLSTQGFRCIKIFAWQSFSIKYILKRNKNATLLNPLFLPHGPHGENPVKWF